MSRGWWIPLFLAACTSAADDTEEGNSAPRVSIVAPADNATFTPGLSLALCATLSDDGGTDALTVSLESDVDGAIEGAAGCEGGDVGFSLDLTDATHRLTLTATDADGASGSDTVSVFPTPNLSPTCTISSPQDMAVVYVGDEVTFAATAADDNTAPASLVATLVSTIDGAVTASQSGSDVSATFTPTVGAHTLSLTLVDQAGATGSCSVAFTVENCTNVDGDAYTNCEGDCDDGDEFVYPGAPETLNNGEDEDCNGFDSVSCTLDDDQDGYGTGVAVTAPDGSCDKADKESTTFDDCDDEDPNSYPGATEIADNNVDEDCNGDDTISCFLDDDRDGYGDEAEILALADDGTCDKAQKESVNAQDCDDSRDDIFPGAEGIAGNGTDENCDDEDTAICYVDSDGDGFGDPDNVIVDLACDTLGVSTLGTDCDDGTAEVNPGATELCDGFHNNCDGWTGVPRTANLPADEVDDDGDGYVECAVSVELADWNEPPAPFFGGEDCDDAQNTVFPGNSADLCDGLQNDCDDWAGTGDPGALPADELDTDNDGFVSCSLDVDIGDWANPESPPVVGGDDCLPDQSFVYPGFAGFRCDGYVNDCDDWESPGIQGTRDPDETDLDGDGYVECAPILTPWGDASVTVVSGDDCDDTEAHVYPGYLSFRCDGLVNDCDDWSAGNPGPLHPDESDDDGDDWVECTLAVTLEEWGDVDDISGGDDCDDDEITVYPAASEICDGLHNDCLDGSNPFPTDEIDNDGDGVVECKLEVQIQDWGDTQSPPVTGGEDCDDANPFLKPGHAFRCDGLQNDCDDWNNDDDPGDLHEDEVDDDGDGYVDCSPATPVAGWPHSGDGDPPIGGDDCDDEQGWVYPNFGPERCDGLQNDCANWTAGVADPLDGSEIDDDDDGYVECTLPPGALIWGNIESPPVAGGDDCVDDPNGIVDIDGNPVDGNEIHPDTDDWSYDGVDLDCDGSNDFDQDGDGFVHEDYNAYAGGTAVGIDDCDDDKPAINPDATEVWYDGDNQNCDGNDLDQDGDGYDCDPNADSQCAGINGGTDCDDSVPAINPGASETADGTDEDCDGYCDEDFIVHGSLVINEMMIEPYGPSKRDKQWFEVVNPAKFHTIAMCDGWWIEGASDISINEFDISSDQQSFVTIEPDSIALFLADPGFSRNGGINYVSGETYSWYNDNFDLDELNGNGTLRLWFDDPDRGNVLVDHVDWTNGFSNQGSSSALNPSHVDANDNNNAGYWCFGSANYGTNDMNGTPGQANTDINPIQCNFP